MHDVDLIFYDAGCGFCSWGVRLAARRDPLGQHFRFAPRAGELFERFVPRDSPVRRVQSLVVLTRDGRLLVRSDAVLRVLEGLGGGWGRLARLGWRAPRGLRDAVYASIAAVRSWLPPWRRPICALGGGGGPRVAAGR